MRIWRTIYIFESKNDNRQRPTPNQSNRLHLEWNDPQFGLLISTSNRFIHNGQVHINAMNPKPPFSATSHTRVSACDHCTLSTLVSGKGGVGPSSLHTMLEGPMEYVCECKMDGKSTWILACHQMDYVSWSLGLFFRIHLLEVGLTHRETVALQTLTTVGVLYLSCVTTRMNRNPSK